MDNVRHFTRPAVTIEEVQTKLEEACCLYEELDVQIHEYEEQIKKLAQRRKQAWQAFNQLRAERDKRKAS